MPTSQPGLTRLSAKSRKLGARLRNFLGAPPLQAHLTVFALMLLAPAVALAGILIADFASDRKRDAESRAVQIANDIAHEISNELVRSLTVLRVLSFSSALNQGDLREFHAQAVRTINQQGDALFLLDRSGHHLMHTVSPWGSPLGSYGEPAALAKVLESKKPYVTDLFYGRTRKRPVINVLQPILVGDEVERVLVMSLGPERFHQMLRSQNLADDWITSIADRSGMLIARSLRHEQSVGQPLSPELAEQAAGAASEVRGFERASVIRAVAGVTPSDWVVAASISSGALNKPIREAILRASAWSAILLGLAGLMVIVYARHLSASFHTLGRAVAGVPEPTMIREANEASDQLASMAGQLRLSQQQLELALGAAKLGWWSYDPVERIASWDARFKEIYGVTEDKSGIERLLQLVEPDDADRVWEEFRALFDAKERRPLAVEFRLRKNGQEVCWIEAHGLAYVTESRGEKPAVTVVGTVADITERKLSEERRQLLLSEVNHRAKNMLTLVEAVARQTVANEPVEFLARFSARLHALSSSQDVLVQSGWHNVDLERLVRSQLAHFEDLVGTRISIAGVPVKTCAAAAQTLGMAVHELATNAGKYGALSNDEGHVDVTWGLVDGPVLKFCMTWIERGGPAVNAPERKGFGTTVIDSVAKMNLNGEVSLRYEPTGLVWRLTCPAGRVFDSGADVPERARIGTAGAASSGRTLRVLVVEDDALTAMELAAVLADAGFEVLGPSNSIAHALELVERMDCDAAVLDVNLGNETTEDLAIELNRRGKPFVTVSGYARHQQPAAFLQAPHIGKPFKPERLVTALMELTSVPAE